MSKKSDLKKAIEMAIIKPESEHMKSLEPRKHKFSEKYKREMAKNKKIADQKSGKGNIRLYYKVSSIIAAALVLAGVLTFTANEKLRNSINNWHIGNEFFPPSENKNNDPTTNTTISTETNDGVVSSSVTQTLHDTEKTQTTISTTTVSTKKKSESKKTKKTKKSKKTTSKNTDTNVKLTTENKPAEGLNTGTNPLPSSETRITPAKQTTKTTGKNTRPNTSASRPTTTNKKTSPVYTVPAESVYVTENPSPVITTSTTRKTPVITSTKISYIPETTLTLIYIPEGTSTSITTTTTTTTMTTTTKTSASTTKTKY